MLFLCPLFTGPRARTGLKRKSVAGRGARPNRGRTSGPRGASRDDDKTERVPDEDLKEVSIPKWKHIKRKNTYRFIDSTCEDPCFWTNLQLKCWEDFYSGQSPLVCVQAQIYMDVYNREKNDELRHVHACLEKLGLIPLLYTESEYCPALVAQFYCTLHATGDARAL